MKLIHLNTRDVVGGAAIAASRMHIAFLREGYDSEMWVANRSGHLPATHVVSPSRISKLRRIYSLKREYSIRERFREYSQEMLSISSAYDYVIEQVVAAKPDVVLLHWTSDSFINPESLARLKCPVIQVLHDMWPLTGLEHYTNDLDLLETGTSASVTDAAFESLRGHQLEGLKRAYGRVERIGFWADSRWLAGLAQNSYAVDERPVSNFTYPCDPRQFRMVDRNTAREILGVPLDAKIVLAGAHKLDNPRKGVDYLIKAIHAAAELGEDYEFICLGSTDTAFVDRAKVAVHNLGYLNDPVSLSLAYSASDVVATPSVQEAFGQVCQEAMMCGTPVVAFDVGGHRDQITHLETGFLAPSCDVGGLVDGLRWGVKFGHPHETREMIRGSAISAASPQKFIQSFLGLLREIS